MERARRTFPFTPMRGNWFLNPFDFYYAPKVFPPYLPGKGMFPPPRRSSSPSEIPIMSYSEVFSELHVISLPFCPLNTSSAVDTRSRGSHCPDFPMGGLNRSWQVRLPLPAHGTGIFVSVFPVYSFLLSSSNGKNIHPGFFFFL